MGDQFDLPFFLINFKKLNFALKIRIRLKVYRPNELLELSN